MSELASVRLSANVILAVAIAALIGCASSSGRATDHRDQGDGLSCETAVLIVANDTTAGIRAERQWLEEHYPGYQLTLQGLGSCHDFPTDKMEIRTRGGESKTIIFNIKSFFGK